MPDITSLAKKVGRAATRRAKYGGAIVLSHDMNRKQKKKRNHAAKRCGAEATICATLS